MKRSELKPHPNGLYRLFWKTGGDSVAVVGSLHDGTRWFAPSNWVAEEASDIAQIDWRRVNHIVRIEA